MNHGKTENRPAQKNGNGYIWNAMAGVMNAAEAVILSMVVTRTNGLADAGILSIAFAVGNLMMAVGKFGVRNYQVTDLKGTFSFSDYFYARIATVGLMAVFSMAYLWYCVQEKGYYVSKTAVILAICFIYATESIEDVFWGLYQQKQALDTGAQLFIIRWAAILSVFILVLVKNQNLCLASVCGAITGAVVCLFCQVCVFHRFSEKMGRMRPMVVYQLLKQCFPLFAVSFLSFYVINAPKYAIDRYLSEEVQACYGFIAMPVFVIGLLNSFTYQPTLVQLALEWKEGRSGSFRKRTQRQCLILAGLTLICLTGAFFFGVPVLSLLYGTDLGDYKIQMLILLFGGGIYALAGYLCVVLTIMRKQRMIMYGYAAVAAIAAGFSNLVVRRYAVTGACVFYFMQMTGLAVCYFLMYQKSLEEGMS